jgi:hypothetical protein
MFPSSARILLTPYLLLSDTDVYGKQCAKIKDGWDPHKQGADLCHKQH